MSSTEANGATPNARVDEEKDSPAFRLRPRRSTPKILSPSSPFNGQRYSMLRNVLPAMNQESMVAVKRKLFRLPQETESKPIIKKRITCRDSITSNVSIGVFVERITVDELSQSAEYPSNYISLRIMSISTNVVKNGVESHVSILMTQPADKNESTLPFLPVYLYDDYSSIPDLDVGKIIEITKFKTASNGDSDMMPETPYNLYPYKIVVKPQDNWVPFVNIKTKYENFVNRDMLHVSTLPANLRKESPQPMRFTSYCTKAPPEVLARRQSSASASSTDNETIIEGSPQLSPSTELGSPVPAMSVGSDEGAVLPRRKRMCRSTSDLKMMSEQLTPQKLRPKQRRACSSSHV